MRALLRFAFLALVITLATIAQAADDTQLLKAVNPPSSSIRVRVPVAAGLPLTDAQIKGQVPKAKKKSELVDVTFAFDTLPGKSMVAAKKWQSWGYDIPANKVGVLPELVIPATQIAPKVTKGGRDVEVRITSLSLEIVDPPGGMEQVYGSDLYIRLNDITKNADRAFEPRFYFGDKTLELTVPNSAIKRLGTGDDTPPEPAVNSDNTLVMASGAMSAAKGTPMFNFASINGLTQYKLPDGKMETVNVGVSSNTNWPGGIMMTIGTARGCGVEMENGKDLTGTGTTFETQIAKGKLKEFRLGFLTGAGFKTQNDFVLKDVTVYVDKNNSGHFVWLGNKFVNEYLHDGIYSGGADGSWKTLGRIKPEFLQDIKTRMPPPKKP
jgi:hypothetical protein